MEAQAICKSGRKNMGRKWTGWVEQTKAGRLLRKNSGSQEGGYQEGEDPKTKGE